MKVKREYGKWDGTTEILTDQQIVELYLTCRYPSSSGQLEQLQDEIVGLKKTLAELLLKLHGKAIVDLCEDKGGEG